MLLWKAVTIENCAACHVLSQGLCLIRVNSRETTFEHQRAPAARFNNIYLKLFDRHATYCYSQVDLKSFLASGAFFLRPQSHRASYDFTSNTGKLKKQGNFWLPRKRKECAPEFKTLADYVIPHNKTIFWHWYCFPSSVVMDFKDWKWIETKANNKIQDSYSNQISTRLIQIMKVTKKS